MIFEEFLDIDGIVPEVDGREGCGFEGQLKRWMVVSSEKEHWGQDGEWYYLSL